MCYVMRWRRYFMKHLFVQQNIGCKMYLHQLIESFSIPMEYMYREYVKLQLTTEKESEKSVRSHFSIPFCDCVHMNFGISIREMSKTWTTTIRPKNDSSQNKW